MSEKAHTGSLLFFFVKFVVIAAVFVYLWWQYLMPLYGQLLIAICEPLFKASGNELKGTIETHGLLNTETLLIWSAPGQPAGSGAPMLLAQLVTNIVPFVALVLATSGLGLFRTVRALIIGIAVLLVSHVLFFYLGFLHQEVTPDLVPLTESVALFFLTLPFLLWIVLAYWGRFLEVFTGPSEDGEFHVEGARLLPDEDDDEGKK